MGTDIHGFIEVKLYENHWYGIVNIGTLVNRNYDMFGIFPLRGFPEDISDLAKQTSDTYDKEYGYCGESYLYYPELKKIMYQKPNLKNTLNDGWNALLEIIDVLAKKFGDDNVRIVVWFTN